MSIPRADPAAKPVGLWVSKLFTSVTAHPEPPTSNVSVAPGRTVSVEAAVTHFAKAPGAGGRKRSGTDDGVADKRVVAGEGQRIGTELRQAHAAADIVAQSPQDFALFAGRRVGAASPSGTIASPSTRATGGSP